MIIRPAGYSSDEGSEYESGFEDVEYSRTDEICIKTKVEDCIKNGLLQELKEVMDRVEDIQNFRLNNGWKPITYAAFVGNPDILEYFIELQQDNDINNELYSTYTPLMAVCNFNEGDNLDDKLKCLEILLNLPFDINFKDRYGVTALMIASKSGKTPLVEMLMSHKVDINICDNEGCSALFYAVTAGHLDVVLTLLKYDADINIVDKQNRYPYNVAYEKNYKQIAELIKPEIETDSFHFWNIQSIEQLFDLKHNIYEKVDVNYFSQVMQIVNSAAPNMDRYLATFAKNKITLHQLLLLKSDEELKQIGVSFSLHRSILIDRIRQFHLHNWSTESLGLFYKDGKLDTGRFFHLNNILSFLATVNLHMYVLRTTILYIRNEIVQSKSSSRNEHIPLLKQLQSNLLLIKSRVEKLRKFSNELSVTSRDFLTTQEILD